MRRLALDAATIEAAKAFAASGIESILIKGPAIAGRLYADPSERLYSDGDLLVDRARYDQARLILRELGYTDALAEASEDEQIHHASTWRRDVVTIDLHRTLYYAPGDGGRLWQALRSDARTGELLGTPLLMPSDRALALIISAHRVQHVGVTKHARDLELAIETFPDTVWEAAAALARELGADAVMGAGLRCSPAGSELADRLGLTAETPVDVRVQSVAPAEVTLGVLKLMQMRSPVAIARFLAAELVPSPAFMRDKYRLARRGQAGLLCAYAYRPFWLARRIPAAVRVIRSAR